MSAGLQFKNIRWKLFEPVPVTDENRGEFHKDIDDLSIKQRKQRIVTNAGTDTGVGFEAGNIPVAANESLIAAAPSGIVGLTALAARATHEFRKAGMRAPLIDDLRTVLKSSAHTNNAVTNNKATRWVGRKASFLFNKMVDKPNVGILVSSAGLGISSVSIPVVAFATGNTETLDTLYQWGQEETILGAFSLANLFNAATDYVKNRPIVRNVLKGAGIFTATAGVMMVGGSFDDFKDFITLAPEALSNPRSLVYGVFAGAVLQSFWQMGRSIQAGREIPATGLLQPQLMYGAGAATNAGVILAQGVAKDLPVLEYAPFVVANLSWVGAYISLDAVFKDGGLHQKYFTNRPKASEAGTAVLEQSGP